MSQYTNGQFTQTLQKSWFRESQFPELKWNRDNSARGQCAVSTLVIQDYFGGEFKRYKVDGDDEKHFVNVLPDGQIVDATRAQYSEEVILEESTPDLKGYRSIREKLLADEDTLRRYDILKSRVEAQIGDNSLQYGF